MKAKDKKRILEYERKKEKKYMKVKEKTILQCERKKSKSMIEGERKRKRIRKIILGDRKT